MEPEFKSTLLREKFVLHDPSMDSEETPPTIALSNRMVLPLTSEHEKENETYIVRTQNMHSCVRLCAAIAKEYEERGPMMKRVSPFHWEHLWKDVTKGYEKDWNPNIWGAIYYKGRVIFEDQPRHPLLDIIEKCDAASGKSYAESVTFAESAFQQAGKTMKIDYDSNVALLVSVTKEEAKSGIILRGANKKTTFNFTAKKKKTGENIRVPTILAMCAGFLEGVQLAFSVGMANKRRDYNLLEKHSDEDRKFRRAAERLLSLDNAIETAELKYFMNYRPDRPNLKMMVRDAEDFAKTILKPQIEAKINAGELDSKDWVL
jgi:hypothetical protein